MMYLKFLLFYVLLYVFALQLQINNIYRLGVFMFSRESIKSANSNFNSVFFAELEKHKYLDLNLKKAD